MTAIEPLTPYQRKLFLFLGVATFFEGFDQMALAQLLPAIRHEMHLDEWQTGLLISFTNVGTVLAYLLVRQADRWGRKRLLTITIAGYTIATFLTGLVSTAIPFAILQMLARIFLIGEWAISMVYAAEEFPASRRGSVIGIISAFGSFGAVLCAAIVPILVRSPLGWRTVYFVGTIPLVLLALTRRGLNETARFEALDEAARAPAPLFRIFRTSYAPRVVQMALIWGCAYLCTQTAITFFKQHAVEDLHMEESAVGRLIALAAVVAMPLVFLVGRMLDRLGRHRTAMIVFTLTSIGCVGCYTLRGEAMLFAPAVLAIYGASAVLPVMNAYSTELFPTDLRSDAFAWSNNLLGRGAYVLSPIVVGLAAEEIGWGLAVASTAIGPLLSLALILRWLPETRGKELEDTSRL